jgi:YebC/PmpR family DNA-binding regulatory protein
MSGHSKWATIKRKKAKTDSSKAKAWNKLIKEIAIAAKMGGGDPESNPRLRNSILKAKSQSLPAKNIESAIKKGLGGNDGEVMDQLLYEGYGPAGTAFMVSVLTNNKTRTVAEIRNTFNKNGGNMGEPGSVSWGFKNLGQILVEKSQSSEDELFEIATEAGADDINLQDDVFEIRTSPETFYEVHKALEQRNIEILNAELTQISETLVKVEGEDAEKVLKLVEKLEDNEDVQDVYHNADIVGEDAE